MPDEKKDDKTANKSGSSKPQSPKVLKNLIVLVVCIWLAGIGWRTYQRFSKPSSPAQQKHASDQPVRPPELPPLPGPIFGVKMMRADKMVEVKVPAGYKLQFDPAKSNGRVLSYDVYINKELTHHYGADKATGKVYKVIEADGEHWAGFVLSPDQGAKQTRLRYVLFTGSEPPSDWYMRSDLAGLDPE